MRLPVWGVACGFQTPNFIWRFQCFIWYIATWQGLLQFLSMQPTRQDVAIECCQPGTEVDNATCQQTQLHTQNYYINLVQCGFSISYLPIPGIAAHDRCNFSLTFNFSFQLQCRVAPFIYITVFQEDSKQGSVIGAGVGSK